MEPTKRQSIEFLANTIGDLLTYIRPYLAESVRVQVNAHLSNLQEGLTDVGDEQKCSSGLDDAVLDTIDDMAKSKRSN